MQLREKRIHVRSRSKPSSVKRLRRLLTSPFMGLVIFMLLIVLAILGWLCLNSPTSIEPPSATSSEISSAFWFSGVFLTCEQSCTYNNIITKYRFTYKNHSYVQFISVKLNCNLSLSLYIERIKRQHTPEACELVRRHMSPVLVLFVPPDKHGEGLLMPKCAQRFLCLTCR